MFRRLTYGYGASKKTFVLSPYTVKEERDILVACTLNEEDDKNDFGIDYVFDYLKSHIEPFDASISKDEKKLILYNLRGISVGDEIQIKNICPFCSKGHESALDISSFIFQPESTDEYFSTEDLNFYFKDAYIKFDENPEDFIYCISNVYGSINSTDKFEIKEIIEDLEINKYDELIEFIKKNITVFNFSNTKECPYCKEEVRFKMSEDTYILDTLSEDTLVSYYKTVTDLVFHGKFSKLDIDSFYPFERNIYVGLIQSTIDEYNKAKTQ